MHEDALEYLSRADPILGRLIARVGPCPLKARITARSRPSAPYEALVHAITHQQLNPRAAETIFNRVLALYDGGGFPAPKALLVTPEDELRRAGLSRGKVASVRDIAQKTVAGVVPTSREIVRLSEEEILERLTIIRGVGTWTVQMLLMFHLGRPDVLPVTDYGMRRGFQMLYRKRKLPEAEHIVNHGERWRPFRSVASWYFWRVLELDQL